MLQRDGVQHFIENNDAGHDRLAGKVPGQGGVIGRDREQANGSDRFVQYQLPLSKKGVGAMVAATVAPRFGKAEIERMIPHAGSMVLLDNVEAWSADHIVCTAHSHASATNPLRRAEMLSRVMAIEYAARAVAVHGGLCRNLACGEAATAYAAESANYSAAR